MIKHGKTKSCNKRYFCVLCRKIRDENYTYQAYKPYINGNIIQLTIETRQGYWKSAITLLKRIVIIARYITKPISANEKLMKLINCTRTLGTRKITSGCFAMEKI